MLYEVITRLDLLGVVGGEAREDQKEQRRQREVERGALQEDVHHHRDDAADQAHDQERAEGGEVALGGVAVEAEAGERGGGDEEHARDRRAGVEREDVSYNFV